MATTELKVVSGKQAGKLIPLPIGKFLIGREEDCHLRPNSDLVSRHHCVFLVDEYGVRLRDLGSTNGTFINGERLAGSKPLDNGMSVECGGLKFEVVITQDAAPADVEAPEEPVVIDASDETPAEQTDGADADAALETPTDVDSGETMFEAPVMPPLESGDTKFQSPPPAGAPVAYPPQYAPQSPGYPPQGYPQQYPGYPPQGYPQQYPGYPPQGYPQQYPGYPPQQQQYAEPEPAAEEPPPEPEAGDKPALSLSLPDPSETGAPPPEPKKEGGGGGKKGNEVVDAASDIIRQYLGKK